MALRWDCGESAPVFQEDEIAGLIAEDAGVRTQLIDIFTGSGKIDVDRNGVRLTALQIRDLAYLTGICRRPSAWLTRDSLATNLKWAFTCRSLPFSASRVRETLSAIGLESWRNSPELDERIEALEPAHVQALALARLRFVPYRVLVIDSPLTGWSSGERSLLLDALYVSCETSALKLIIAARRAELPPFCDRMATVVRDAHGLAFAEMP